MYNDIPGHSDFKTFVCPEKVILILSYNKMYGAEPRYNSTLFFVIKNTLNKNTESQIARKIRTN